MTKEKFKSIEGILGCVKISWKKFLPEEKCEKSLTKAINHYSHNSWSDLEPRDLSEKDKESFEKAFQFFIQEFRWSENANT